MADSVARITSMLEKARNLGLEAAAAASARLADTPKDLRPQEVSKLLSSSSERDILKGLKYVISLVSGGEDAAEYFTDVVKNVSSSNLSIRKLVYSYLLRYAEEENDVALLSVNAIQKSIGDKNEQVRALAIRVMSEIRISSIYQIVLLGIKKSVSDPSPIVRRAAAISVINVFNNHGPSSKDELVDFIKQLLRDKDPHVLGSVILAYRVVCPDDYTLLHGHFHRICSMMGEFDEWTAIYFIEILTNYSRHFLPKPKIINTASIDHTYIELPDNYNEIPFPVYDVELDQDLKEFLDSIKSSVYSRNEAVILATARAYFHLTPPKTFKEAQVAPALVRCLLTSPPESRVYILQSILYMAIHDPTIFVQYEKRFYLLPRDNASTAEFKLKVLSAICNENNIKSIIHELQYYSLHSEDPRISVESVKAIGVCSQISEYWSSKTLKWLLSEVVKSDRDSSIITEFLTVIRHLVQHNPENNVKTVVKLAHLLDIQDLDDSAKESIIWLIGEFTEIEPHIGPDVLRKLLKTFTSETSSVRYQTILLASKIYLHELEYYKNTSGDEELNNFDRDSIISRMFNYVMKLGRYDDEYDTRDRSRMLYTLLNSKHTQLASLFLQAPKPVPLVTLRKIGDPLSKTDDIVESLPVDDIVKSYNVLPPWCDSASIPPSSIREPIEVKGDVKSIGHSFVSSSSVKPEKTFATPPVVEKKFKLQSLDDFFADEPARQSPVHRRIIYEEETDSDEESEEVSSEEESDDDDEDDEGEEGEEEQEEEDEDNGKYETIE